VQIGAPEAGREIRIWGGRGGVKDAHGLGKAEGGRRKAEMRECEMQRYPKWGGLGRSDG
jgi:hypothetical protein